MMHVFLRERLRRVYRREQMRLLGWQLAAGWIAGALVAGIAIWMGRTLGRTSDLTSPVIAALVGAVAVGVLVRAFLSKPNYRRIAERVEKAHPELGGLVLTAVQQEVKEGVEPGYLQHLLLQQAMERSQERDWRRLIPKWQILVAHGAHGIAFVAFVAALIGVSRIVELTPTERAALVANSEMSVTPGDTQIERGESLVVLARFGNAVPSPVELVVSEPNVAQRKIPLVKSLADPVFGGTVPEVSADFTYRVSYGGEQTREYKVTVFEHPRLERADMQLTFPAYTKLEQKRIEDTRRLSAVEGTKVELTLQLNKPVISAQLVSRDKAKTVVPLVVSADRAVATLPEFTMAASQTYDLKLLDADGRSNKQSTPFVIDVQVNRRPELRLVSPRGDIQPSALEEVAFDATVWDDFGSPAFGFAYSQAGKETKFIELGRDVAPKDKRAFKHMLHLEDLGVKPNDLVSWYLWADDVGPDGQVRRTNSDLYFGEVRPFDEIFREDSSMQSGEGGGGGAGGGAEGRQARRLSYLQKQIINATWKLKRDPTGKTYKADTQIVRDSQVEALEQTRTASEQIPTPRIQAQFSAAAKQMEEAATRLNEAVEKPESLTPALVAEQAAYQALLKLEQKEINVARNRRGSAGGQGGEQQMNQRQLDQLDLAQEENRYETQRQARAPQNQERKEQLQAQNRLQELARRQQDVNERLKELQTALQEAHTEKQKEELRRQLKRLQEEQREMLADLDELRQRMDRPENQSRMAEQRKELEQAREDLQRAAEATGEGSVAQALAAGTRAQRQLQDLRDSLRKENSSQFSEELRDMRGEARDVARQQKEVSEKLNALSDSKRKTLSDEPERKSIGEELTRQQERVQQLVDRATKLSEQAENTEPLLSRHLYESLRKVSQDDANASKQLQQEMLEAGTMTRGLYDRLKKNDGKEGTKAFDITSELLREGLLPQASSAERKARAGVEELRRGVERAAESVLGDDAEALRLAQSELDALTEQLGREAAQELAAQSAQQGKQGQRGQKGQQGEQQGEKGQKGQAGQKGAVAAGEPGAGEPGASEQPQGEPGSQPGQGQSGKGQLAQADPQNQPGQPGAEGQPGQPGQPGQQGQQGQQGSATQSARQGQAQNSQPQPRGGAGGGGGARDLNTLLEQLGTRWGGEDRVGDDRSPWAGNGGPITGGDFGVWSERLRDVEEVLDTPELRDAVAAARERARLVRQEYRRDLKKPDWAVVRLQIMKPLIEVRTRISEELARRESNDPLSPVDRDPVPPRFAESVKKYYEELGKDR